MQLTATQLANLNEADRQLPFLRKYATAAADQVQLGNLLNFITGTATIPLGSSSVAVAVGLAYDGKPAFAQVMQAAQDATLLRVELCTWDGAGNLTIKGLINATANVTVSYFVDGRS